MQDVRMIIYVHTNWVPCFGVVVFDWHIGQRCPFHVWAASELNSGAALGGTRTHDTLLTRQSALPTELPGQLSRQGSLAGRTLSLQHNTTQHKAKSNPNTLVLWHRKPSLLCRRP